MRTDDWRARGMVALVATVLALLGCGVARAGAPCPSGDPRKVESDIPAPCDGWVISEEDALHVARMRADLDAERKAHDITKRESVVRVEAAEGKVKACKARVDALESTVDDCKKLTVPTVPWNESPEFVAPVSAVATAIVVVLVVVLIYEAR